MPLSYREYSWRSPELPNVPRSPRRSQLPAVTPPRASLAAVLLYELADEHHLCPQLSGLETSPPRSQEERYFIHPHSLQQLSPRVGPIPGHVALPYLPRDKTDSFLHSLTHLFIHALMEHTCQAPTLCQGLGTV